MSEVESVGEPVQESAQQATAASGASQDASSSVVVVQLRRVLINCLNRQQRQLGDYMDGFLGARDRELAITQIWEGYFASPERRARLEKAESWDKVAEELERIDSFGTLSKASLGEGPVAFAAVFDEELASVKEKVDAARWDNAPPADSANEVRRCVNKAKPAVRRIREACEKGVTDTLKALTTTIAGIFEAVEMQSAASEAGVTVATKLTVISGGESERESASTKTAAGDERGGTQAAAKGTEGEIPMETAS